MADVDINKFRASVVRDGSKPSSPGFIVSEGQDPVNPPGTNNYVPYSGATANVELGEYGVEAGFITLDTTPTNTPTDQGTIFWDADDETVDIVLNGYTMKIGEDLFYPVKNQTGSTIAKGVAVRFNGTVGASGRLLIAPFIADGSVPSSRFMGVTAEEILNGEDGKVLYFGRIRGINTNAFNEGDILYASTTVAGGYQTAIPVAPNNIVQVAAVVTKSSTVGTIFVRPTLGSNINKDEGVKIVSVADKNLLQYQSGTSLWENKSLAQVLGGTSSQFVKGDGSLDSTSYQPLLTNPVTGTGTTNYLPKFTGSTTIGNSQVIDNGTELGIGLTPSAGFKLDVGFTGTNRSVLRLSSNAANRQAAITFYGNNIESGTIGYEGGSEIVSGGVQGDLVIRNNLNKNIVLTGNNVLVGTTTDNASGARLQVSGTATVSSNIAIGGTITSLSDTDELSIFAGTTIVDNRARIELYGPSHATLANQTFVRGSQIVFTSSAAATEYMRFASTGVATFSNSVIAPNYVINRNGSDSITTAFYQQDTLPSTANAINMQMGASGGFQFHTFNGSWNNRLTITSSGSVGIGTPSPGQRLHVIDTQTSNTSILQLRLEGNGGNFYDIGRRYDSGAFVIQGNQTGFNNICLAPSGGNVLIGTTTDNGARLQVSGFGTYTVTGDNTRAIKVIGTTNRTGYLGHAFGTLFIQNNNYFNGSSYVFDDTSVGCANVTLGQDIAFQTGAANTNPTTKVFITNAGNVGIGTITPVNTAWGNETNTKQLSIDASDYAVINLQGSTGRKYSMGVGDGNFYMCYDNTAARHNITVTSSGSVGIGTNSPVNYTNYKSLHISGATATGSSILYLTNSTQTIRGLFFQEGTAGDERITIGSQSNHPLTFFTNDTERMRITSGGDVLVGSQIIPGAGGATTGVSLGGSGFITAQRNAATLGFFGRGTNDGELFAFYRGTTQVGNISVTGSSTSYNTSSDYRLKEDLQQVNGLEKINAINVYNYKWKTSTNRMDGVLAHELAEILPYAVFGVKDGEQMQSVDYSKIVPLLIQSIQELKQEIDTLKN